MARKRPPPTIPQEADAEALALGRTLLLNLSAHPDHIFLLHVVDGNARMELCSTDTILARAQAARNDIATQYLRDIATPA